MPTYPVPATAIFIVCHNGQGRARCAGESLKFIVLSPLHSVIEPTGRFHNDMEKESGIAERLVSSFRVRQAQLPGSRLIT